ncbi:hypothetical protein BCR32DRAFT_272072, partial [Anaeromyces robustus]
MEKKSFRQESKGISKRLVNLFYMEKKINSWQIALDFNRIFDIKALKFISYYWRKLQITRKYYFITFLLALTNKNIIELNKNNDFNKLLEIIEKDCTIPNIGLDKKYIKSILSILYSKLSINEQKNDKEEYNMKDVIKLYLSKLEKTEKKYKYDSPLFVYINHNKKDDIRKIGKIKWKQNERLPTEKERIEKYRKLKYIKNKSIDDFLKRKNIFEPVEKEKHSFLRSRHNFSVNKSISVPKSSGSMLATNQTKKLVLLEEKELEDLKKEEKLRQEQEEEEKRKRRYKKRNSSQTDNTNKDNTNKLLTNGSTSNELENGPNINDPSKEIESSPSPLEINIYNEAPTTPIHNNETNYQPVFSSLISIDSSSDSEFDNYTPKTPVSELSPSLPPIDIDMKPILSSNDNIHDTIENNNNNLNNNIPINNINNDFKPHTYLNSITIDNTEVHLETSNLSNYLWDKEENIQKINKIMNSNSSLKEEANKIINKYIVIDDDDKDDMNINNIFESSNSNYNKNIYLKIYKYYKMNPEQQSKNPIKFKFNYFPSINEKYPEPINNIINLTEEEKQ